MTSPPLNLGPVPDSHWRFNETSFRRFIPFYQLAIDHHPTAFTIDPAEISLLPSTFVRQFRDSANAFCHPSCRWSAPFYPLDLKNIFKFLGAKSSPYILTNNSTHVYIGPNKKLLIPTDPTANQVLIVSPAADSSLFDASAHPEILSAILTLLSAGLLTDPVEFTNLPPSSLDSLSNQHPSLEFDHDPSTSITTII